MSEPISESAFNILPQGIRDWVVELGWKREDILTYHVQYGNPIIVILTNTQKENKTQNFVKMDGTRIWQKA